MKELIPLGIFLVFIGLVIIFVGLIPTETKAKTESKFFFGGIIGFIPFGFGNDKRIVYVGLALMIILLALSFLLMKVNT